MASRAIRDTSGRPFRPTRSTRRASIGSSAAPTAEGHSKRYGERLLDRLRVLFGIIHRRDSMAPDRFACALETQRKLIVHAATHPP